MMVQTIRVGSAILLSCLSGPIKNMVLLSDTNVPREYRTAKAT